MKKLWLEATLIVFVVLAGCSLDAPPAASSGTALPPDGVSDVLRSYAGDFRYETVLAVDLKVQVVPYAAVERSVQTMAVQDWGIVAELRDSKKNLVYAGRVGADGTLDADLLLPAAGEDLTLKLSGAGFGERQIVIRNMVQYSEVSRVVAMLSGGTDARSATELLGDLDGDAVADIYDAFPGDPDSAFTYRTPAKGKLTVAFEDLFGQARAGDADYNDFIAKYTVEETADADNAITRVTVNADADTKLAGYDHRFGIRIDTFQGKATLSGTRIDALGTSRTFGPMTVEAPLDVVLFENTRTAVGKSASFTLDLSPQGSTGTLTQMDRPPYNPYLYVRNTGKEIHLMGEQDLSGSYAESYQDGEGFPWALLVPSDWVHPDEGQRIEVPYPRFAPWRESFGQQGSDWYLPATATVTVTVNNPPYPVNAGWRATGAGTTSGTVTSMPVFVVTNAATYYQLQVQEVAGLKDPEGDAVLFKSGTLPSYVSLDAGSGLVTIAKSPPAGTVTVDFWSEDAGGASTSATPYKVTFSFVRG